MESLLPYCSSVIGSEYGIFSALLIAGLVSGFTHCAGMCGPFVVMQTNANMCHDQNENFTEFTRLKNSALLPYHMGRITTYMILSMVASYMSAHIMSFESMKWFSAILLGISGMLFITYAISNSKITLPGINKLKIPAYVEDKAKPLFQNPRGIRGYGLGMILGLIPCGMMIAAILAVSSTGNVATAATAMMLFGLGTIPGLFSVSYGSNFLLSKLKLKEVQSFVIFISGAILVTTAYGILF